MKRAIAACIVILLLLPMLSASVSTAGTITDPLISLSYLNGIFAQELTDEITQILTAAANSSLLSLDGIYGNYAYYDYTTGFTRMVFEPLDTIMLTMGSSFILHSGSASITYASGTVIDLTSGNEVASAIQLETHHRYFCAENTNATVTVDNASIGLVDGFYLTNATLSSGVHRVFRDVLESAWYYNAVDFVYNSNLFQGTASNMFSPNTSMTRAMFVTVLHRLDGLPSSVDGISFADVNDRSEYYYNAVMWATANSIVTGYTNGLFGPDDLVTREQMAAIIHRYADYKNRDMSYSPADTDAFADFGDVSDYAVEAMRWAVSNRIINGSNNRLLPGDYASRAEVAQIICNYVPA